MAPPPAAPPPDPLLGVMGVSDWEFLAPERGGAEESDPVAKRPSLDDFDGEIAIFQVSILDTYCAYMTVY